MKTVNINREELLKKVKENAAQHEADYKEMEDQYPQVALNLLKQRMKEIKKTGEVNVHFNLRPPEDHRKDYNTLIKMLEMSVDNEIELNQVEFQEYVLNQWEWQNRVAATKAFYSQNLK